MFIAIPAFYILIALAFFFGSALLVRLGYIPERHSDEPFGAMAASWPITSIILALMLAGFLLTRLWDRLANPAQKK